MPVLDLKHSNFIRYRHGGGSGPGLATSSGIKPGNFARYQARRLRPVSSPATSPGIKPGNFARYQARQ
ncbi:MAG: hypothetical protein ABJE95_28100, partial [Byssovorax sp.]